MTTDDAPGAGDGGRAPLFTRGERVIAWLVGSLLAIGLLVLALWHLVFVQVPPGFVGVRYSLLAGGTIVDDVLPEGYALKLPWDRIYLYETRIQQVPFRLEALSVEGMLVTIEGAILYRPKYDQVARLQKSVGPEYRDRLVLPLMMATMREIIAQFGSHELYSVDYDFLQERVLKQIQSRRSADLISVVDLLVTSVMIPPNVRTAIEHKLSQEQLAASYEFRLASERYEAERKRIEAIGIQTYYAIVSASLNDTLLTWRGIEATVELSRSSNTKIVVVGGGKDQMPLILGGDIARQPSEPDPKPVIAPQDQLELPDWSALPKLFPESSAPGQKPGEWETSVLGSPAPQNDEPLSSAGSRSVGDAVPRRPAGPSAPPSVAPGTDASPSRPGSSNP